MEAGSAVFGRDVGKSTILEPEKESKGGLQIPGKDRVIFNAPSEGKSVLGLDALARAKKASANDGSNSTKNTTLTTMAELDTEENPVSIGDENNSETLHHKRDSKAMRRYRGTHVEETPYLGERNASASERKYDRGSAKASSLDNGSSYRGGDQCRASSRDKNDNWDSDRDEYDYERRRRSSRDARDDWDTDRDKCNREGRKESRRYVTDKWHSDRDRQSGRRMGESGRGDREEQDRKRERYDHDTRDSIRDVGKEWGSNRDGYQRHEYERQLSMRHSTKRNKSEYSPRRAAGRSDWDDGRWEWDDTPRRIATPGHDNRSHFSMPSPMLVGASPDTRLVSPWLGGDTPYAAGSAQSPWDYVSPSPVPIRAGGSSGGVTNPHSSVRSHQLSFHSRTTQSLSQENMIGNKTSFGKDENKTISKEMLEEMEEAERDADRAWYDREEVGTMLEGDSSSLFIGDEATFQKRESEMGKRLIRKDGTKMSLAQSKKMSQMSADNAEWEDRQLMRSGAVRGTEVQTEFEDEDENRVILLVHDTKPPFLDGRVVFTKQAEPIMPVKDPTSDMAIISRKGSALVREIREKQSMNKSRQRFWELAGSKLGNILGVEKTAEQIDADQAAVGPEGEIDFKEEARFASHMKEKGEAVSEFAEEVEVGSRLITFETGKLARFAAGAVVLGIKETKVLSTVVSQQGCGDRDFLPLTVDYREKHYAQGKIPNTFMRREGAPKERELLCGRVIDRSIRPLFPKGFYDDVQVIANVLSSDGEQDPDVMAATAASAALTISDIPWDGPIGVVRVGRIDGKFVVNPDMDELSLSDLNLVYSCTRDKTLMIETQAREITNNDLIDALHLAHSEAIKLIDPQLKLAAKVQNQKKEFKLYTISDQTLEKIEGLARTSIETVFADPTYGKFERGKALNKISDDVKRILEEEGDEESLKVLPKAVDTVRKKAVRERIFEKGLRVDGRSLNEVRPLYCEAGTFPALHGSSIFSRGNTQVLCTVTLGAPSEAQYLDALVGPPTKRFMVHYSFPPFSINEVGKQGGLNRREVGHGTLAEKALLALLPPEDEFPYIVRLNSEVMASDGSTSMATVCGGSLALMDAGVPLREHVAAISVGLVTEVEPSTGEVKDYRILTDILGLEDHLGDMDFKIAGTRKGVTSIQLDIKPAGIPLDILCQCLDPAFEARKQILDFMEREINYPREEAKQSSPRLVTLSINQDYLSRLIGPQGSHLKKIEQETGSRISVNFDGTVTILAKDQTSLEETQEKVEFIAGREIEVGGIYKAVIVAIKDFGAFVDFGAGKEGLLHISEMSHDPVVRVSDVVSVGQKLSVMCIGRDLRGNVKVSLKAMLSKKDVEPKKFSAEGSAMLSKKDVEPKKFSVEGSPITFVERSLSTSNPAGCNGSFIDSTTNSVSVRSNNCLENQASDSSSQQTDVNSRYSSEVVLIRSAEECDAKRVSEGTTQNKNKQTLQKNSQSRPTSQDRGVQKLQKKTKNARAGENKIGDVHDSMVMVGQFVQELQRKSKITRTMESKSGEVYDISDMVGKSVGELQKETKIKRTVETKSDDVNDIPVTIGKSYKVSVQQIRSHGLVLQLDGGVRGMLRFEAGGKNNFEVGEELCVTCTCMNSKGIPVFSLVETC